MMDHRTEIARLFRGFDHPRLMPTVAVDYIEVALTRQTERSDKWEAAEALLAAIKAGRLLAYGDDQDDSESVIPINDFANAEPFPGMPHWASSGQKRVFRWYNGGTRKERRSSDFIEENGRVVWKNISIETEAVLRLWPFDIESPVDASSSDKSQAKPTKVNAIRTWLVEKYPIRPPLSVDELMRQIKESAPGIGLFEKRTCEEAIKAAYGPQKSAKVRKP